MDCILSLCQIHVNKSEGNCKSNRNESNLGLLFVIYLFITQYSSRGKPLKSCTLIYSRAVLVQDVLTLGPQTNTTNVLLWGSQGEVLLKGLDPA